MTKIIKDHISQAQVLRAARFWYRRNEWIRYKAIPAGWPQIPRVPRPRDLTIEGIAHAGGISETTLKRLGETFRVFEDDEAGLKKHVKKFYPIKSKMAGFPSQCWKKGYSQKVRLPGPPPKLKSRRKWMSP